MKLKLPKIDREGMIDACIRGIRDTEKKERLKNSKEAIVRSSEQYVDAVNKNELFNQDTDVHIVGGATKDDMVYLYDERLVKSVDGKPYYDKIKSNVPLGKCPICGYSLVDTIDHYLPKSVFHQYTITLENLVPLCIVCNKNKGDYYPNKRENELIHPYFDDFDDEVWLIATINKDAGDPFGFLYTVRKPESWNDEKYQRAKFHVEKYHLDDLFSILAADDVNTKLLELKECYEISPDIENLRGIIKISLLVEEKKNLNSRQTAMYRCLYESDWLWNEFLPDFLAGNVK